MPPVTHTCRSNSKPLLFPPFHPFTRLQASSRLLGDFHPRSTMRRPNHFLCAAAALLASSVIPSAASPTDGAYFFRQNISCSFTDSFPPNIVPSAASFYVPSIPNIHQDPERPLRIFAGNILSDPRATSHSSSTEIFAHLYFVLVENRRSADKERIMFWFNVWNTRVCHLWQHHVLIKCCPKGRPRLFFIRRTYDGSWSLEMGRKGRVPCARRWLGRVYHDGLRYAELTASSSLFLPLTVHSTPSRPACWNRFFLYQFRSFP